MPNGLMRAGGRVADWQVRGGTVADRELVPLGKDWLRVSSRHANVMAFAISKKADSVRCQALRFISWRMSDALFADCHHRCSRDVYLRFDMDMVDQKTKDEAAPTR